MSAFLTTTLNSAVRPIHPKRMPVLLVGENARNTRINGDPGHASKLAHPHPTTRMKVVTKGDKKDAHC